MSSREFFEWMEYAEIEPFGAWRDNYHAALIASTIANIHRSKKSPPIGMDEFFYRDKQTERERKTQKTLSSLEALANNGR